MHCGHSLSDWRNNFTQTTLPTFLRAQRNCQQTIVSFDSLCDFGAVAANLKIISFDVLCDVAKERKRKFRKSCIDKRKMN